VEITPDISKPAAADITEGRFGELVQLGEDRLRT
jgi:hypothetical protein